MMKLPSRRSSKYRWLFASGFAVALVSGGVFAYIDGGHYYTLIAVNNLRSDLQTKATPDLWPIEVLCAELPDMSEELDAVTQREKVLMSPSEHGGWGWGGKCVSPVSRHMVATHFYLHALTNLPAEEVRNAAATLVQSFDPVSGEAPQDAANRVCARGFALHLLGDSFAHSRLDQSDADYAGNLYSTGLGHGAEFSKPDYMSSTKRRPQDEWRKWAAKSKDVLGFSSNRTDLDRIKEVDPNTNVIGNENDDDSVTKQLLATDEEYVRSPDNYDKYIKDISKTVKKTFLWQAVETHCQDVIDDLWAHSKVKGFTGTKPQCESVWSLYIAKASKVFNDAKPSLTFDRSNVIKDSKCFDSNDHLADGR